MTTPTTTTNPIIRLVRSESGGGALLLLGAVLALIAANTGLADSYVDLQQLRVGPSALGLDLTLTTWAQDALLAVFFFIAGLELKHELVLGELADRRKASLPILAALGGVVVPALIALGIGWGQPGIGQAWAIPVATDIAFALGVLAMTAKQIPFTARVFLLSLAVVDDLIAIAIIALVFTASIAFWWLLGALATFVVYFLAQQRRITTPWLYVPLAVIAWYCLFQSGVHATVAGVVLGLLTRVIPDRGEPEAPGARLVHRLDPWSAGLCVPIFAFFAAGVPVDGEMLSYIGEDRIAIGVIVGLVVGKAIGIFGTSWLAVKLGIGKMPAQLHNADLFALAVLGGIGFTVSLLVAELSLEGIDLEAAKAAVLIASLLAAVLGSILIGLRGRAHRRMAEQAGSTDEQ